MDIIIQKLELHSDLSPEEKDALRSTFASTRAYEAGQDVLKQGEPPAFVGALLSGMLARYKLMPAGLRQIVSFPLAGDIFDLQSFMLETMDHGVGAISRATVATATHAAVEEMVEAHPRLAMLLARDAVVEGSVFREWVVNCGCRPAFERLAHLFCELYVRSNAVGLAEGSSCPVPLTQAQLSDATGLSVVHVNRVLQRLRSEKLIRLQSGGLTILDWDGLASAAGFNVDYLHITGDMRGRSGPSLRSHVSGLHGLSRHTAIDDSRHPVV